MDVKADGMLSLALLLAALYMVARGHSSKKIQFQQMAGQALRGGQTDIRDMKTVDIEACAFLCIKDETCKSLSYHDIERVCTLSSAYPVIPNYEIHMLAVFIKVEDTLQLSRYSEFTRHHELLVSKVSQHLYHLSLKGCGEMCILDHACYGFKYYPLEATCMFISELLSGDEQVEASNEITYLVTREAAGNYLQNIAQGKPASQSTTHDWYNAGQAVDGNFDSSSSTYHEVQPYWMVDLEMMCDVVSVNIFVRKYSSGTYGVYNPIIYIGKTENKTYVQQPLNRHPSQLPHRVCGYFGGRLDYDIEITCQSTLNGRFVYINSYREGSSPFITMSEVEVYGSCES